MEAFLRALLPRLLPEGRTFDVHPFQGKHDLLAKLEPRLRSYATWLPDHWRIVVVVDRDDDDCHEVKRQMEEMAERAGLVTRTRAGAAPWQLVNRVAVEELEAWYFGDWQAVRTAYTKTDPEVPARSAFRNPDAIVGGTWEAFEHVMQKRGYFKGGLRKIEAARAIGAHVDAERSTSHSFRTLCLAIREAVA